MRHKPVANNIVAIFCLSLLLAGTVYTQKNNTDRDRYRELRSALDSLLLSAEKKGFSGTIRLKKDDDDIILYKGYGFSDCSMKKRTGRDMVYDIGSITKAITATAVLRLVQNQKLNLEDNLGEFFSGWPEDKKAITILQLLTHTSGLEESLGIDEDTTVSKETFLEKVKKSRLLFQPGENKQYSNTAYTLLGYIIEKVSGISYEGFIKRELFDVIGIKKMGYANPAWNNKEIVCGWRNNQSWGSTKDYFSQHGPSPYLFANGGLLANATELSLFFESLIKKELLPGRLADMMITHMSTKTKSGNIIFRTSGSNIIFSAAYSLWMKNGMSVVLFTNNSEYPKEKIEPQVLKLIENFINSNRN